VDDGTTIKVNCPSNCLSSKEQAPIYGTGMYTDTSSICLAAIHAGIIDDTIGGLVTVTLERGINFFQDAIRKGTLKNGLTSLDMSTQQTSARLFSLNKYPLAQVEVQTIAGSPSALLKSGCGFRDGMPPLSAQFNAPSGLEIYSKDSLTRTKYLYIADSGNHRIRSMTATCSKICENGGVCSAPDTCSCPNGWSGDDCTVPVCSSVTCANRQVCVGPNQCACIPGFTGFPACTTAQCVQICANGGKCTAPDTCSCTSGWFDTNCTTPVCTQTCGNGGNCTAPNTCSCATEWKGTDCRLPVCEQECKNGGSCVAPNTCQCPAGWSGHDCSTPVCSQGFFVPHPNAYKQGRPRPFVWPSYVPCPFGDWCEITKEFDCLARLSSPTGNIPFGPSGRWQTGRKEPILNPKQCFPIEVGRTALTHFPYLDEQNKTHGFFRYAPKRPFLHNATRQSPWRVPVNILDTTTIYGIEVLPPFNLDPDRQVALVEKRNIVQGVYACANGGSCVAPDICECKSGWIGFDCRTPVCSQGYYVPDQTKFVASDPPESKHPRHPISNPPYTITVETMSYENVQVDTKVKQGDIRYKFLDGSFQGGYACSIRSLTQWEKPTTIGPNGSNESLFEHPNYFSGYMDKTLSKDGFYHTHWKEMYWPPLYELTQPLLDDTREGWKRAGIWIRISSHKWQKGKCLVEFQRTCTSSQSTSLPVLDLETNQFSILVTDPDVAYRSRVNYSHIQATRKGFWNGTEGKECIDQVIRGCFNNGTCIGPNTCKCAEGWKGSDCSIPICEQNCLHHGNCTLPNRCTCEKGWTGKDCSIPLCAQECRNNGTCISPDTCECQQWESDWRDGRENGGQAVFKTPQGTPQLTGWTGYDCSTPICVQAEKFVFNVNSSKYARNFVQLRQEAKDFHVLRGRQFGKEEDKKLCEKAHRCPQFDEELVSNDGQSFQFGCENVKPILQSATVKKTSSDKNKLENLRNYMDHLNVDRTSKDFLCGNFEWEQGDYIDQGGRQIRINYRNYTKLQDDTWKMEAWSLPGEGIYECFHQSACIAPDTCSCSDGYEGIDCRKPQCRFLQANGSVHFGC
jgi:hypothetical protein